jgi:hypothetical protein
MTALTHVNREFTQVRVELTREAKTCGNARHDDRYEVVQVVVLRRRNLECAEVNVVQRLVIDTERLVRVLHKLVHGQRRVVRLHNSVGHLRRRHDRVRAHHPVRVLLADLGDKERAHAGTGTTTKRVGDLEAWLKMSNMASSRGNRYIP